MSRSSRKMDGCRPDIQFQLMRQGYEQEMSGMLYIFDAHGGLDREEYGTFQR